MSATRQPKKSLTCSRAFGNATPPLARLREAVTLYKTLVGEKLRRGRLAGVVTVFVHTDRFAEGAQYYNAGTHRLPNRLHAGAAPLRARRPGENLQGGLRLPEGGRHVQLPFTRQPAHAPHVRRRMTAARAGSDRIRPAVLAARCAHENIYVECLGRREYIERGRSVKDSERKRISADG